MKKSELRTMIREMLHEELAKVTNSNHKKLKESAEMYNRLPCDELDDLVARFNAKYSTMSNYAKIVDVACIWESADADPDIEIKLSNSIDENAKNYILIKLFADFVRDIEFDDLLELSWLNKSKDAIIFWYGRLENIGIDMSITANYEP